MVHDEFHFVVNGNAGGGKQHPTDKPKEFWHVRHIADGLKTTALPRRWQTICKLNRPSSGERSAAMQEIQSA
jgi:hypothetical protein